MIVAISLPEMGGLKVKMSKLQVTIDLEVAISLPEMGGLKDFDFFEYDYGSKVVAISLPEMGGLKGLLNRQSWLHLLGRNQSPRDGWAESTTATQVN